MAEHAKKEAPVVKKNIKNVDGLMNNLFNQLDNNDDTPAIEY